MAARIQAFEIAKTSVTGTLKDEVQKKINALVEEMLQL
jgi:hypothetical protein